MLIHAKVYETNLQRMRYLNNPSIQTFADSKKKKKKEKQTNKTKQKNTRYMRWVLCNMC